MKMRSAQTLSSRVIAWILRVLNIVLHTLIIKKWGYGPMKARKLLQLSFIRFLIIKWGYVSIKDCQDLISNETLSNLFFRLTLPTNIKEIKRLNFVKLEQTKLERNSRNLFAVKNSLVYKYPILFHILVAGIKVWKRCSLDNREVGSGKEEAQRSRDFSKSPHANSFRLEPPSP